MGMEATMLETSQDSAQEEAKTPLQLALDGLAEDFDPFSDFWIWVDGLFHRGFLDDI